MFYVYAYCNPKKYIKDDTFRFQPFYIGKGSGNRSMDHLKRAKSNKPGKLLQHIRNLLSSEIEPFIVKVKCDLSESEAFALERDLITKFGRKDIKTGCLLNFTTGGEGEKHSPQTRLKIANSLRGRKGLPEINEKIRNSLTGRTRGLHERQAISKALLGKKRSIEVRHNISKATSAAMISSAKHAWTVLCDESFCVRTLDDLEYFGLGSLYGTFRTGLPMPKGKFKGMQLIKSPRCAPRQL
jgi:hypothetical protein